MQCQDGTGAQVDTSMLLCPRNCDLGSPWQSDHMPGCQVTDHRTGHLSQAVAVMTGDNIEMPTQLSVTLCHPEDQLCQMPTAGPTHCNVTPEADLVIVLGHHQVKHIEG